ncbi:MAG: hypothetical protein IE922_14035 [Sphingomonadales bacterium]|nr:hypothetical protein [Sphingomonadales bacterium]
MDPTTLRRMSDEVSGLLVSRLGARGPTLAARIDSRARALPRKVRRAAQALARAEACAAAPKIARQIDPRAVGRAHATCVGYLRPLGMGQRLWGGVLQVIAALFFGGLIMGLGIWALRAAIG